MMDPERWHQITKIYHAVLEHETGQRTAILDTECREDGELRGAVERMLKSHDSSGAFIETPAFQIAPELCGFDELSRVGEEIAQYKIESRIGAGGMGEVYLARDRQLGRKAALKVVKRGMDTEFILSRFRAEQQLLASFDHPNIARLWDGGATEDGLPYFAMEYVQGAPVDDYCEAHGLTLAERLRLFRTVCSAVQYAHQRLVIHRDLKPSNILVTEDGAPKLLDFGIAKLLSNDGQSATMTDMAIRAMTPEYASPEQIRGQPVTTATDVYSLGVVLYELLTGQKPHKINNRTAAEAARAISEKEPTKPSTAVAKSDAKSTIENYNSKLIRGDLDNIVLMAMRPDPTRRYASVNALSEDIRRYLAGLPVMARRDTFAYRTSKFVRRNRVAVSIAAVAAVLLLLGAIAILREARLARAEQAVAEHRLDNVRKLAHTILFDYNDALRELRGATPVREKLVRDALQYLDGLSAEAREDRPLQRELAAAYEKLGEVQGIMFSIGDTASAIASHRKALRLRQQLAAFNPTDVAARKELATSYRNFGLVLWAGGDTSGALELVNNALRLRKNLVAEHPQDMQTRVDLVRTYADVGEMLGEQGHADASMAAYQEALALAEVLSAADPQNEAYKRPVIYVREVIAELVLFNGEFARAIDLLNDVITRTRELGAVHPDSIAYRYNEALYLGRIGEAQEFLGNLRAAAQNFEGELAILQPQADSDPKDSLSQRKLSETKYHLGTVQAKMGELKEGRENSRQALVIREQLANANPGDAWTRSYYIQSLAAFPKLLAQTGDRAGALAACRKAESFLQNAPEDPTNMSQREFRANACGDLAEAHAWLASETSAPPNEQREQWLAARELFQKGLEGWLMMQSNHTLSGQYAQKPNEFSRQVARCNAALGASAPP
jgi:serine/threonine protein kinase